MGRCSRTELKSRLKTVRRRVEAGQPRARIAAELAELWRVHTATVHAYLRRVAGPARRKGRAAERAALRERIAAMLAEGAPSGVIARRLSAEFGVPGKSIANRTAEIRRAENAARAAAGLGPLPDSSRRGRDRVLLRRRRVEFAGRLLKRQVPVREVRSRLIREFAVSAGTAGSYIREAWGRTAGARDRLRRRRMWAAFLRGEAERLAAIERIRAGSAGGGS
jgi:hypothetical protein